MIFIYGWLLCVLFGAAVFFLCIVVARGLDRPKFKRGDVLVLKGLEPWHDKNHKIITIMEVGKKSYQYRFMEIELTVDINTIIFKRNENIALIKESDFLYINKNYERFKNKASKLADIIYT